MVEASERLGTYTPKEDDKQVAERTFAVININADGTFEEELATTQSSQMAIVDNLSRYVGNRSYEGKNHLGNVLVVFADSKEALDKDNDGMIDSYEAVLISANDYYPFGSLMPNRKFTGVSYRYGFNGMEKDDEFKGEGNSVNYKYRMHDPRIGRFFAVDPLSPQYPHYSPYMFSGNKVIAFIELEGLEEFSIHSASFAPFDQFGGPFSGDGDDRKFGTDPSASSRIYGTVKLDATAAKIELVSTDKRGSISRNNWIGTQSYSEAKFSAEVADIPLYKDGFSASSLNFDLSGNNSQIPSSPDIDVNGTFVLLRQDLGGAGSRISITGMIYGDKFPANETFLTDEFGTGVFLGVSGADGNPFTSLPGAGSSRMSTFEIYVNFDIDEKITGVTYGGETYSVDDWNKKFEKLDPKSGDVATEND